MIRRAALLVLLFASAAFGAVSEQCGNGIDDSLETGGSAAGTFGACPANYHDAWFTGQGCDADCSAPDKDNDGVTSTGAAGWFSASDTDCDDTDGSIYPGVYTTKGCSAGNVRLCNSNGTYGSCVADSTIDESTNGGGKIYVSPSGADVNPGTYASPKGTLSGCLSGLTAGGVCYVKGSGSLTTGVTLSASGTGSGATTTHPIRLYGLPGNTVTIDVTGQAINVGAQTDIKFRKLRIKGTTGGIVANGYARVEVEQIYVSDLAGDGDVNHSCLGFEHGNYAFIHHSLAWNCRRDPAADENYFGDGDGYQPNNPNNISAIKLLDNGASNGGGSTQCKGHRILGNTVGFNPWNGIRDGIGVLIKHGCLCSDVESSPGLCDLGPRIGFNHFVNMGGEPGSVNNTVMTIGASGTKVFNNLMHMGTNDVSVVGIGDIGGSAGNQKIELRNNTSITGRGVSWTPMYTGSEQVTIDRWIIISTDSAYSDTDGVISIHGSGTDAQKSSFELGTYLLSNNNNFYSPNATAVFSYYSRDSGSAGDEAGGNYSFASWKLAPPSGASQDSASILSDPGITSPKYEHATYGYTVPTSTTTTTVTTTTAAYLRIGSVSLFPQN